MIRGLVIQKLTIAGKEYEYPDTTALVGKINELADVVNRLEESVQGVVNNSITDGGRIQTMCEQLNEIKQYLDWNDISGEEPTMAENASVAKNVREPITLIDMFNEMGRLYADLWNKMEDIHHELKKEQQ